MTTLTSSDSDRQWYIVGRWQQFEGEGRANLLRMLAVGVFYGLQLAQFHLLAGAEQRDETFHRAASCLAAVGILVAIGIQLCLRRRIFPAALKYFSTAADLVLVTSVCLLGSGAHSPLRLAYFVVIALAALRFSLPLVWCASLGSMLGYLVLVGSSDPTWFDEDHVVPPIEQLVMLVSLALSGVIIGQILRRTRGIAAAFAERQLQAKQGVRT